MKNLVYKVEEFHRGKWIPLKNNDDKQKTVHITKLTADQLNYDAKSLKTRYVLVGDVPAKGEVKQKAPVAPAAAPKGVPTMENTKAEIVVYLNDNEIEIPKEAQNKQDLLDLIK